MAVFQPPPAPLWTQHRTPFDYRPVSPPASPLYDVPIDLMPRTESTSHRAKPLTSNPPRPPNAWILYRSDKQKDLPPLPPGFPRRAQADISKLLSNLWKSESADVRSHYERLSDIKKAEHQLLYPGYRFQPMKKAVKDRIRAEKLAERERERGSRKLTRVGRSRTASSDSSEARSLPSAPNPGATPPPVAPSPKRSPTPPAQHPTPNTTSPTLAPGAPAPSPALYPSSPATLPNPVPLAAPQPAVPQRPPSVSDWQAPPLPLRVEEQDFAALFNSLPELATQEYLSFPVPAQYPPLGWTPADPAPPTDTPFLGAGLAAHDPLQAILTPTDDPYVFNLHNLDFSFNDFAGDREIEISLDNYHPPSSVLAPFDTLADTLFPEGGLGLGLGLAPWPLEGSQLASMGLEGDLAPIDFAPVGPTPVDSVAPVATETYAPPAGAAISPGTRRVAADWRTQLRLTPEPEDY